MATPPDLGRRAVAELLGTGLLVTAVIGSGIAASRLSPGDIGLQLLENSAATGAALVALIVALGPVSAAFNPVVTLVDRVRGLLDTRSALALIGAQLVGGVLGAVIANLMFGLAAVSISTKDRGGSGRLLGEVVATVGLLLVIAGAARTTAGGRTLTTAIAVGSYIAGAYWFTSSTSFANPAVTIARMFSDTFAGIAPRCVPAFVGMQLLGAVLAAALIRFLHPTTGSPADPDTMKDMP